MSYNKLTPAPMDDPFADGNNIGQDDDDDLIINDDNNMLPQATAQQTGGGVPPAQPPAYSSKANTYEGGYFSVNHYRQYFDLNTVEFLKNCYTSINPFTKISAEDLLVTGDLYGAIWITGTVIFLLFFCNGLSALISDWVYSKQFVNQNYFQLLITSINLLYGYLIFVPLCLYLLLRFYFKLLPGLRLSKLISIYGYSNIWWVPAAILSTVLGVLSTFASLSMLLKWILVGFGGLLSGLAIFIKLGPVLITTFVEENNQKPGSAYAILIVLLLCHIGVTIGVQVSFFGKLV